MYCMATLLIVWRGKIVIQVQPIIMKSLSAIRDAISDTSDGYPDMASALGVKLTMLEDKMPFAVS